MAISEADAREENVKSWRSIACCLQLITLLSVRQSAHLNIGGLRLKDFEDKLDAFSVDSLDE